MVEQEQLQFQVGMEQQQFQEVEQTVEPPAEAATEPTEAPAGAEGAPEGGSKPKTPWYDIRIGQLSEQKRLNEARIKELEMLLALKEEAGKSPPQAGAAPESVPVSQVEKRAQELAAEQVFNAQCNDVVAQGKRELGAAEFQAAIESYGKLGGMQRPFIEAALETGMAHRVIYELSKDPDEATRIMGLPPLRQAAAVARYAAKMEVEPAAPTRITKAPPPIKPKVSGGGKGEPDLDDPNLSMKDYVRLREAQIAAARKRA